MKGQADVVSAVLIFGIIVSVVGATYLWGVPLIQKQQAFTEAEKAEVFVKLLNEKIQNVDKGGQGSRDVIIISESGVLTVDPDENVVRFTTHLTGTFYILSDDTENAWNPVVWGPQDLGIFGKDGPSIIRAKAVASGDGYDITYEILFRPLLISGTDNTFELNITSGGATDACGESGEVSGIKPQQLFISNEGIQKLDTPHRTGGESSASEICIKII